MAQQGRVVIVSFWNRKGFNDLTLYASHINWLKINSQQWEQKLKLDKECPSKIVMHGNAVTGLFFNMLPKAPLRLLLFNHFFFQDRWNLRSDLSLASLSTFGDDPKPYYPTLCPLALTMKLVNFAYRFSFNQCIKKVLILQPIHFIWSDVSQVMLFESNSSAHLLLCQLMRLTFRAWDIHCNSDNTVSMSEFPSINDYLHIQDDSIFLYPEV